MRRLADPRPAGISLSLLATALAGLAFVSPGAQIPPSRANRTMKILHICTSDAGGAGKAALRLHEGLLLGGVDSKMLVQSRQAGIAGVFSYYKPQSLLKRIQKRYKNHRIVSEARGYRGAKTTHSTSILR